MTNHDGPAESTASGHLELAGSYCCECGTYDTHKTRCLCCGYDFRTEAEVVVTATE